MGANGGREPHDCLLFLYESKRHFFYPNPHLVMSGGRVRGGGGGNKYLYWWYGVH